MNRQTIIRQFSSTEYHSNLSLCRDAPVPFPLCLGRSVARGAIPSFFTAKQKLPAVSDRKSPLLQRFAYFVPLYFMASSSGIVASKSTPYQGLSGFCRVTSMVWAV